MLNLQLVIKKERFVSRIAQYLNAGNYNKLYAYVDRTSWFVDSSTLHRVVAMLEENITRLNRDIWVTPVVVSGNNTAVLHTSRSLDKHVVEADSSSPNPQYQALLFNKKKLQLSIHTIKQTLDRG